MDKGVGCGREEGRGWMDGGVRLGREEEPEVDRLEVG